MLNICFNLLTSPFLCAAKLDPSVKMLSTNFARLTYVSAKRKYSRQINILLLHTLILLKDSYSYCRLTHLLYGILQIYYELAAEGISGEGNANKYV